MDFKNLAVCNISKYGDTDIFPFPIENALFYDHLDKVKDLLSDIEKNFHNSIHSYPVEFVSTCIPVGFTGFRWATQIDPIWNAYLLYLVLSLSTEIEQQRIDVKKDCVFSYRIVADESTSKLFTRDVSWKKFIQTTVDIGDSKEFSYVIKLDISDFYNRIYHHRLENSLDRTGGDSVKIKQIMEILQDISGNVSYGLPVGGNAARILAELLLVSFDKYLLNKGIRFCRFVDDFVIFANSKESAFRILNMSAEYLLRNQGLSLQKTKTQILSARDYVSQTRHLLVGDEDEASKKRADFFNLNIYFDPYSPTAVEDYEAIREKLSDFDVLGLLKEEIRKSRIHQAIGKQLLNVIDFLEDEKIGLAFQTISANLDVFYPIFPSVLRAASKSLFKAPKKYQDEFIACLCQLCQSDSYIIQNDNTLAFLVRVLAKTPLDIADQIIDNIFNMSRSPIVKANCICAMTNRKNHYWLLNLKSNFITMSRPERRAFIATSFFLGDEGKHWRNHTKKQFTDFENLVKEWVQEKKSGNPDWKLPI